MNRANKQNLFFNRVDTMAPLLQAFAAGCPTTTATSPPPIPRPYRPLVCPPSCPQQPEDLTPPPTVNSTQSFFTTDLGRRQLTRLHSGKAAGPDSVLQRVLKACAPQLCGVLSQLFSLSLHLQRVPVLWKTSCLVPLPKTQHPSSPDVPHHEEPREDCQ